MELEVGGSCPRCDAEYRMGVHECPACRIPLVGIDVSCDCDTGDAAPPGGVDHRGAVPGGPTGGGATVAPAPGPALDRRWSSRLSMLAAGCSAAVLTAVAGGAIRAAGVPGAGGLGPTDELRRQQVGYLTKVATPGLVTVAVVGAVAVALGRHVAGERSAAARAGRAQRLTFVTCTLLTALATLGLLTEIAWRADGTGLAELSWSASSWLAALLLSIVATVLSEPRGRVDVWRPAPSAALLESMLVTVPRVENPRITPPASSSPSAAGRAPAAVGTHP